MRIQSKNSDPRTSYRNALDLGVLQPDQRQYEIVGKLQDLYERLLRREERLTEQQGQQIGFLSALFGKKSIPQPMLEPGLYLCCLLYTSPSPRDLSTSRMPSSA